MVWYGMVWYGMHPATIPLAQVVSAVVARRTLAVRAAPWGGRSGVNKWFGEVGSRVWWVGGLGG